MNLSEVTAAIKQWNIHRTNSPKGVSLLRSGQFLNITKKQYQDNWENVGVNEYLHLYIGVNTQNPVFFALDSITDKHPFNIQLSSKIVEVEFNNELTISDTTFDCPDPVKASDSQSNITHYEAWKRGFRWLMFSSRWFEDEKSKQNTASPLYTGVVRVFRIPMKDLYDLFCVEKCDNVGLFLALKTNSDKTVSIEVILTNDKFDYPCHEFNPVADVTTPFPPFSSENNFGLLKYSDSQP